MSTTELSIRSRTATTDVGAIWKAALVRYEAITTVKIESLGAANNVEEILADIHERETKFKTYRHDSSKLDRFRSLVSRSLGTIEKLSNMVAQAVSTLFPPSTAIFTAAAGSVSADYDKITGLFEDLDLYLSRLKILETWVPSVPELEVALAEVLASVLCLCAISAKYIKVKRIVKAFRNLTSGEDDELATAYAHFHKMVQHEHGAIRNVTLAGVGRLQKESTAIYAVVREGLDIAGRTDSNTQTLINRTERLEKYLESHEATIQRADILAKLSSLNFHEKQNDIFAKCHHGTGQWLIQADEFEGWLKGEGSSILWCPGIPGAGKTVLTSLAVNHTQKVTRGTEAAIVYIYCDYKDPKTQSELELMSSITRQLTEQTSPIPLEVQKFCEENVRNRRNPTGNEWTSLIKSISLLFRTTYLFIDALDECPEINRDNFLSLIGKIEPFVRLFITSRPHLDLKAKFPTIRRIDISASVSDVKTYLENEISTNNRLSLFTAKDSHLREDIIKCVSEKTTGMFLFAYLQIQHLCRQQSLKMVRKTMDKFRKGVLEFYGEAMMRIQNQEDEDSELAIKALSYIFCARRPLVIEELLHALAAEADETDLDEAAFPDIEILLSVCAGLIMIDENTGIVGLVHFTLQEYLEDNPGKLLPDLEVEMARACLTYLNFDAFEEGPCQDENELSQRLQKYQFLDYASRNWGFHVLGGQLHERVIDLVLRFLKDEPKLSSSIQILYLVGHRIKDWQGRFPEQFKPLHVVAYWGLDKILTILSEQETDVDIRDSDGATALQLAARNGHMSVIQLLLANGADVNTKNDKAETAVYWAARNEHTAVLELLLLEKAHVLTKDYEGWTALDWGVLGGNNEVLRLLLEHGTDISANDDDGRNKALCLAAEEGHELTVQMLIDNGAKVNAQDALGSTALDFAAPSGHEKTMRVLLQNGADVRSRDIYGNSILHLAVNHKALVQLLLKYKVDIDATNDNGQPALSLAAQDGPPEVVELLLQHGADVDRKDKFGFTALHRAVLRRREATVRLLLDYGASSNVKDKNGWTPLHVAALKGHEVLVQVLLPLVEDGMAILDWAALQLPEKKAEASTALTGLRETIQKQQLGRSQVLLDRKADVDGKDIGGWTALIIAATKGHQESVKLLLDNGADVNISGYDGRTALHWACDCGNEEVVQLLVENGADVNASAYGWTALLLAAKSSYMSIVFWLIQNGADVNADDYHGRTALHWAAKHGSETIVEMLVEKGANIDALDRWGRTAIVWTAENTEESVVQILLDLGADVKAKSRYDLTVLHMAAFKGWHSIVAQLLKQGANVEAEAYWGRAQEIEYEECEVEMAEAPLSGFLCQWFGLGSKNGLTPRQLAVSSGQVAVLRLLEQG
ncbi:Ankyrin repeat-containing protein [Glarea lozoyensis ATCC 20868]|uniref:Ankyrin repeat-containing protein n=1 Tax=Glarea lozoyensis (strain ATCC 20868 / MF5171) TaxID=1116229 RepID=S3DXJ1_GLAL2|nr:Ankyrin repeat-containing protein [Glarea lozoyensis ATCC 20868]EPE36656.1 Ankyrin repeat-containing protein [Glarea lozoyensis ATCC 20868]